MFKAIIKLIRIKQWVKNGFVIAPFIFALKFTDIEAIKHVLLAFGAFCFVSSFVYVMNDIVDRKKDALHPKKKFRPIASGKISIKFASTIALLLLVACASCLHLLNTPKTTLCLIAYVLLNIFYSIRLKNMILLDVLTIAVGFILRLYAGAYAIQSTVSGFIFMTTLFLASFLGFTKRKSEILRSGQTARKVLKKYTEQMIDQFIGITATLTIISYALYTMEPSTIERLETNRLIYSIFFVIYGIFRYFYVISKPTEAEDPTENLYKDKGMIAVCGWMLPLSYYKSAVEYIRSHINNPHFFVFCAEDPEYIKNIFDIGVPFELVGEKNFEPNNYYENMRLMNTCQHAILANSAYCWWAAYLSDQRRKNHDCPLTLARWS